MTLRGTLYRCHFFTYAGPQTAGVLSRWTQDLVPIGDQEVFTNELVEMLVEIDGSTHALTPQSRVRFDLLEQDHFLTGGVDDLVVSFVGTGATQPDSDFPVEERTTVYFQLDADESLAELVRRYKREHPEDFMRQILLVEQGAGTERKFYLIGWWTARRVEDYANAEIYFIVNVDEAFDDQSEDVLDVSPEEVPPVAGDPPPWHPRATVRRIFDLLSTSITDWSVTLQEARDALALLQALPPEVLLRTVGLMRLNGRLRRLAERLEADDPAGYSTLLALQFDLDPNRGYIVPGDRLRLHIHAGSRGVPELTAFSTDTYQRFLRDYPRAASVVEQLARHDRDKVFVDPFSLSDEQRETIGDEAYAVLLRENSLGVDVQADGTIDLPYLENLRVADLLPQQAANVIAEAYFTAEIYRQPHVRLIFERRGAAYLTNQGELAALHRAFDHYSTWQPDPNDPEVRRGQRRATFLAYISGVRGTDPFTITALLHYYAWLDQHYQSEDFFTTPPEQVWQQALDAASQPPPESPLEPFLRFAQSLQLQLEQARTEDKPRLLRALGLYLDWLDAHSEDPDLANIDPVDVYSRGHRVALQEELAETRRRIQQRLEEQRRELDWELIDRRLGEALDFAIRNIWTTWEPYVIETVVESGGLGPFFQERRGVGYLVQQSELERRVRDIIANEYLDDLLARLTDWRLKEQMRDLDIRRDFRQWIDDRPEMYLALELAYSHPDVERFEFAVDAPAWQTAIETGIGFIPIVGQVVAIAEVATGRRLLGGDLNMVERGITAAAIILPAAGKLVGTGGRLMRASQIVREYRLTTREAEALYRASLPIAPGTAGRELLERASRDVREGRRITDRQTVGQLERLLREMGLMDRATARSLRLPARGTLQGAVLASEESSARMIRSVLGEQSATYRNFDASTRDAVRAAIRERPGAFRRALAAETQEGYLRHKQELLERMRLIDMPEDQIGRLERALDTLNAERRGAFATQLTAIGRQRIEELGRADRLAGEGDVLLEGLRRRAQRARDAAASAPDSATRQRLLDRANRLDGERNRLSQWLQSGNHRLDDLKREVANSPFLRDLVTNVGGGPMLQRLWIQYLARPSGRRLRVSFEEYVRILQRHHVGNFGEFEVAFRLGDSHILLKPPDELVTLPGIDLIAIPRGQRGMIHLIDNKALSQSQVEAVDALTRNLPRNLANDVDELAQFARDPNLPAEFRDAVERLSRANQQIQQRVRGLTRQQIEDPAVQRDIEAILRSENIERVVTNAGGQVDDIAPDLRAIGLDLADLNN